jgi:hypothetical protein
MDASVGLTFSLQLFRSYRRNGVLQASIRHMPGVKGACTAYVYLSSGSVTACYLEDRRGQRLLYAIEDLCRIDDERGPFEWIFQEQSLSSRPQLSASPSSEPLTAIAPSSLEQDALIPRVVATLRWEHFNHWTPEQKLLLQNVWKSIDGRRCIQDIKASLPYPPQAVNDIVQILLKLHIVVLTS